jgi:YbbR domain-containing protein
MKRNALIKIIAIVIAISIWILSILQKDQISELNIPIYFRNLPTDIVIDQEQPNEVSVQIKAKGLTHFIMKLSKVFFEIDASNFIYGSQKVHLSVKDFVFPRKLEIELIDFEDGLEVPITTDKLVERSKNLKLRYASVEDEEFFLENKIVNSNQKIEIRGPLKVLNEIKFIETAPISRKMVVNGKIQISLTSPSGSVQLLRDSITLDVSQSKIIDKTISLIPIIFPESENITIIPQKVTIMIRGPKEILEKLDNSNIIARLDLLRIREGMSGVNFDLPSGVRLLEYTPQNVQIISNE